MLFKDPTKKNRTTCPMECVLLYGTEEAPPAPKHDFAAMLQAMYGNQVMQQMGQAQQSIFMPKKQYEAMQQALAGPSWQDQYAKQYDKIDWTKK